MVGGRGMRCVVGVVVGGCVAKGRVVRRRVVGECVVGGRVVGGHAVGCGGRAVGRGGRAVVLLSPSASTPRRSVRIISSAFGVGTPIVKSKHVSNG